MPCSHVHSGGTAPHGVERLFPCQIASIRTWCAQQAGQLRFVVLLTISLQQTPYPPSQSVQQNVTWGYLFEVRLAVLTSLQVYSMCPMPLNIPQDHARVVMEHIVKWRATQLTPWKQAQQQGSAGQQPAATATAADAAAQKRPAAGAAAVLPSEGRDVVCRVYAAYSSMRLGSSVLGLHRDGYLQLLKDAGMVSAGSR